MLRRGSVVGSLLARVPTGDAASFFFFSRRSRVRNIGKKLFVGFSWTHKESFTAVDSEV